MLPGLEKPPAHYPLTAARPQTCSCDSCRVVWAYSPLCCCSQGGSPALRLHAGTSCNSSCAGELQQGWGCRLWEGLHWHSRDCPGALPTSDRVAAATSSAMGRHLCSLAVSAVLSVLCLGLGNDMQALFLLKNFTAPEMFIKVDISKGKQVLGVMEKGCMPLFSSAPRQACVLVASAFPISSTKNAVVQGLESKSRSNLNPLTTKSFLTGQVLLNLVSCD